MKIAAVSAPLFRIDADAAARIGASLTLKRLRTPRSPPRAADFLRGGALSRRKTRPNGITAVDNAMTLT